MATNSIEHPDRRCLFYSKEGTDVDSEVLNEYDDMEIVVCEDTRDVVVETRTSTAKLCQEHAEHCVETGKWEFTEDDADSEPESTQTTLVTDGGTVEDETCQECGEEFNPDLEGYFVDTEDVGPDATGGTAEVFRQDAENFGEWSGFEEKDIGPWCDDCSWIIQRRRTRNNRSRDTDTHR